MQPLEGLCLMFGGLLGFKVRRNLLLWPGAAAASCSGTKDRQTLTDCASFDPEISAELQTGTRLESSRSADSDL